MTQATGIMQSSYGSSQVGLNQSSANSTVGGDLTRPQYKENNVYSSGQQSMINKLFSLHHRRRNNNILVQKPSPAQSRPVEEQPLSLKIVHVGGRAECYYMAVPAARILEKYPSFVLARPDVFKRPWEAVVRGDEVLVPGQKILVVPRSTVKKLRQKIRRQTSKRNWEPDLEDEDHVEGKSKSGNTRRVRFIGIDHLDNDKDIGSSSCSINNNGCN